MCDTKQWCYGRNALTEGDLLRERREESGIEREERITQKMQKTAQINAVKRKVIRGTLIFYSIKRIVSLKG